MNGGTGMIMHADTEPRDMHADRQTARHVRHQRASEAKRYRLAYRLTEKQTYNRAGKASEETRQRDKQRERDYKVDKKADRQRDRQTCTEYRQDDIR